MLKSNIINSMSTMLKNINNMPTNGNRGETATKWQQHTNTAFQGNGRLTSLYLCWICAFNLRPLAIEVLSLRKHFNTMIQLSVFWHWKQWLASLLSVPNWTVGIYDQPLRHLTEAPLPGNNTEQMQCVVFPEYINWLLVLLHPVLDDCITRLPFKYDSMYIEILWDRNS